MGDWSTHSSNKGRGVGSGGSGTRNGGRGNPSDLSRGSRSGRGRLSSSSSSSSARGDPTRGEVVTRSLNPQSVSSSSGIGGGGFCWVQEVEDLYGLERALCKEKEFGIITQPDFLYLTTRSGDYVLSADLKPFASVLNSSFANREIIKVLHRCDLEIESLLSYGLYANQIFDLAEASQVLEFPLNSLGYLFKYYLNVTSSSTLARRGPATKVLVDDARKEGRYFLPIFEAMSADLISKAKGRNTLFSAVLDRSDWVAHAIYKKEHNMVILPSIPVRGGREGDAPLTHSEPSFPSTEAKEGQRTVESQILNILSPVLSTDQLYSTAGWITPEANSGTTPLSMTPSTVSPFVLRQKLTESPPNSPQNSSDEEDVEKIAKIPEFGASLFRGPNVTLKDVIQKEADEEYCNLAALNLSPTSEDLVLQKRIPRSMNEIYKLSNFNRRRNKVKKKMRDEGQLQFALSEEEGEEKGEKKSSCAPPADGGDLEEEDVAPDDLGEFVDQLLKCEEESRASATSFMKEIGWIGNSDERHPAYVESPEREEEVEVKKKAESDVKGMKKKHQRGGSHGRRLDNSGGEGGGGVSGGGGEGGGTGLMDGWYGGGVKNDYGGGGGGSSRGGRGGGGHSQQGRNQDSYDHRKGASSNRGGRRGGGEGRGSGMEGGKGPKKRYPNKGEKNMKGSPTSPHEWNPNSSRGGGSGGGGGGPRRDRLAPPQNPYYM